MRSYYPRAVPGSSFRATSASRRRQAGLTLLRLMLLLGAIGIVLTIAAHYLLAH
ncbi:hypothetical protein [Burkholderia sp. L27(2015)]|jgi:hypothetical protein|uniref:hypothetical protein n=1 Tax=Burkholderia sp. L27(2015) TaxID=1641858 RepID=UPI00131A63B5|nr:hypothetical protein [Burkholderia sp. L27(2015)]